MRIFDWRYPEPPRLKPLQCVQEQQGNIIGTYFTDLPFVTVVGHRTERLIKEVIPLLRANGYRPVERHILTLSTIYARPLPLWAFYKGLFRLRLMYWWFIRTVYDIGLIHPSNSIPDGVNTRLIDWRPGPSRDARLFYRTLVGKVWKRVKGVLHGRQTKRS